MPTETMPKEALTQIEAERLDVERKLTEFRIPHEFVEKYGLEIALLYCQPKVEMKALAEKLGLKLREFYSYSFPILENSHIDRTVFADNVQCEGVFALNQRRTSNTYLTVIKFTATCDLISNSLILQRNLQKEYQPI